MAHLLRSIDRVSDLLGMFGRITILVLILSMMYEVIARYGFGAPTLWAFDISYMLNGSIFLLGAGYALKEDVHIRIDFLSQKFPRRVQQLLNGLIYLCVMAPITGGLAWVASQKALKAFLTHEVESVSPWAPVVWPFYAIIALGLVVFTLQFVSEALKYLGGRRMPGETSDMSEVAE